MKRSAGQDQLGQTACFPVQQRSEQSRRSAQSHREHANLLGQIWSTGHCAQFEADLSLDAARRTQRSATDHRQMSGRNAWKALCRHRELLAQSVGHQRRSGRWGLGRGFSSSLLAWRSGQARSHLWLMQTCDGETGQLERYGLVYVGWLRRKDEAPVRVAGVPLCVSSQKEHRIRASSA